MKELADDLFPDDPEKQHRPDDYDGDGEFLWRTGLFTSAGLAAVAAKYKEQIICGVVFLVILAAYFLVSALQ
jgi:hypothetical protein